MKKNLLLALALCAGLSVVASEGSTATDKTAGAEATPGMLSRAFSAVKAVPGKAYGAVKSGTVATFNAVVSAPGKALGAVKATPAYIKANPKKAALYAAIAVAAAYAAKKAYDAYKAIETEETEEDVDADLQDA